MSRIKNAFTDGKAFIAFITGGDPNLETTERLIHAMDKAGADLIEIGIPFSDPVAEGPVIQAASERALAGGCTTDKLFDLVAKVRKSCEKPIVFMTYINPIFTYGKDKFMAKCAECGIDGVIIPDIPYEEKDELSAECKTHGIDFISLIAPTSHERITMIAKEAEGFVYCVSSMGVTGIRNEINTDISSMVQLVKQVNDIPCAVGFGISTPEQAEKMAGVSDGAIVGSAIVKLVARYGENSIEKVSDYVKSMKEAVMRA
ncbi:MAG: tryptophan synthase subunit alpha [Lachnospiraceae bacterium]|nr:tryptophan synthase subunit alpha [Lachnospiraceae bacterium]